MVKTFSELLQSVVKYDLDPSDDALVQLLQSADPETGLVPRNVVSAEVFGEAILRSLVVFAPLDGLPSYRKWWRISGKGKQFLSEYTGAA